MSVTVQIYDQPLSATPKQTEDGKSVRYAYESGVDLDVVMRPDGRIAGIAVRVPTVGYVLFKIPADMAP